MAAPSFEGSEVDRRFRPCRKGPPLSTVDGRPCSLGPATRQRDRYPSERGLRGEIPLTVVATLRRHFFNSSSSLLAHHRPTVISNGAGRRLFSPPAQPSFRTEQADAFQPTPQPSFRTQQADVFSFHFAPAKWSACVERNLSFSFSRLSAVNSANVVANGGDERTSRVPAPVERDLLLPQV